MEPITELADRRIDDVFKNFDGFECRRFRKEEYEDLHGTMAMFEDLPIYEDTDGYWVPVEEAGDNI